MLHDVLEFLNRHPGATSYTVCEHFGITRAMSERLLEMLEDAGEITLERAATCTTGGTAGGGCSSGGGAVARLNALAAKARETRSADEGGER